MAAQTKLANSLFEDLLKKLSALAYVKSSNEKVSFKTILEQFNSIDFLSLNISNEKASLTINQCCFLASDSDPVSIQLVLSLLSKLLSQQQVNIEGKTLIVAVSWILECVKTSDTVVINSCLQILQTLVRGKCTVLADTTLSILEHCESLMSHYVRDDPPQIFANCLNCLEALTYCYEEAESDVMPTIVIEKSCDIYLKFLYDSKIICNTLWRSKCLIFTMRGLDNIVRNSSSQLTMLLPLIIGAARGYTFYHLPKFDDFVIEKVVPSNLSVPEEPKVSKQVKKTTGKYDRKSKKKSPTPIGIVVNDEDETIPHSTNYIGTIEGDLLTIRDLTSDSDFSDNEGGSAKIRLSESKVRRCSLILLGSLILKVEPRIMTSYLPTILPDSSNSLRTLVTCLNNDPSSSCRTEVLVVMSLILSKFKMFFSLGDSTTTSSFTTLANTVAVSLGVLHLSFVTVLKSENYKAVIMYTLKALSDLIRSTPYHKIKEISLLPVAKEVALFLKRSDVNLRIAALVVFGCITSITPSVTEVREIILGLKETIKRPWLLDQCLMLLTDEKIFNTAVAIESLQVLGVLVRKFPKETVVNHFEDMKTILDFTSAKHDPIIRLYAGKFTVAVAESLQSCVTCEDESKRVSAGIVANIWSKILFSEVTSLMQEEEQSALRAAACDCLATLAISTRDVDISLIYDELPRQEQIISITHLSGGTKDTCPHVRSSAVRALAAFVRFNHLRQDPLFFLDAIDTCFATALDCNISVRIQAAWLFSHITEAALANRLEGLDDDIPDTLLFRMLDTGILLAKDNKKAKPYAVRGVANLLSLLDGEVITEHRDAVSRSIEILIQNASTGSFMKARWNACYALGIALANPAVCALSRFTVLPVLFQLVHNYKNFKVRISAGQALSSLPNRQSYDDFYLKTWQALLTALENAENMADFSEYKHRDQLVDQLCVGLCYLVSIITPADLVPVHDVLLHHIDLLSHNFDRFKNRVVPEKGEIILKADANLSEMVGRELNRDQKNALSLLCTIFMNA